ncbi:RNA-directed DNA polymerase from mobile element jockey isoform X2 [Episyrphus balteatus]|uniref:RNA-directed DNA polymerase from mobile element jockey isoform X2 n=1 Tax=Episyrphus balteatus TaxID=286459 RepID=UPI00248636CB|nr:RNA-directed DNA polymerase from mobile element jockey isoform X2 [Episyrphus balteatus]
MVMREKDIDICLISETHVKKESNFNINGFLDYHAIHPSNKARGGASLHIKDCVKHAIGLKLESMQLISVQVETKHDVLNISSIYCPPRYKIDKNEFSNLLKLLRPTLIIGRDFNAKHTFWGSRCISQKGRALYEAGMENNCDFHSTGKPTYWPADTSKIPDLIDYFIVRGIPSNRIKVTECYDLFSDHSPVIITMSESLVKVEMPPRLTNGKTNWEGFKKDIEDNVELRVSLRTPLELEAAVDNFVNIIQKAAWNNTPCQREISGYKDVKYPQEIKDVLKEKRKALKKWQQTRAPQHKSNLNRLSNLLKKMISDFKNREAKNYLENLTAGKESNYSLWKAIKATKKPKLPAPPIMKDQNE